MMKVVHYIVQVFLMHCAYHCTVYKSLTGKLQISYSCTSITFVTVVLSTALIIGQMPALRLLSKC